MHSNKAIVALFACAIFMSGMRADVPILGEARSATVRPAIFILEDEDGAAARVSEWVKLARDKYYLEAIGSLKQDVAEKNAKGYSSTQTEKSLALVESDAAHGMIPRWAENVFVTCREAEVTVSFFARSGGWSKASNGSLVALHSPAYVCTIEPKTGSVRNGAGALKAVVFADLYADMAKAGVATDFTESESFVAPLNRSKANEADAAKR